MFSIKNRLLLEIVLFVLVSIFYYRIISRYKSEVSDLKKELLPVTNTRNICKKNMILNETCPLIEVDPETYEVRADGEIITCEPAKELPLAQGIKFDL